MSRILLLSLVLLVPVCHQSPAQTLGRPGINDFLINGVGSGLTSMVDPLLSTRLTQVTLQVHASPGTGLVGVAASQSAPGVAPLAPAMSIDIDPTTLWIFIQPGSVLGLPLSASVPPSGIWSLVLPIALSTGSSPALQFGLLSPTFPAGIGVTQAFQGPIRQMPSPQALYQATVGFDLAPLSDDGAIQLPFAAPGGFSFYGTSHSDVFVNMNGFLTFLAADTDYTPSEVEMLQGLPRLAAAWSDWSPNDPRQGTVRARQTPTSFTVEWFDVRRFGVNSCGGGVDSNTFGVRLDLSTGAIEMRHGVMLLCSRGLAPSLDILVGISPGLSQASGTNVDLTLPGGNVASAPTGALYEDFRQRAFSPGFDLGSAAGTPSGQTVLLFSPSGAGASGPYIQL